MSSQAAGPAGNMAYELPFRSIGQNVVIYPTAKIVGAERMDIGDNVLVDDFVFLKAGELLRIGSYVHIAVGAVITGSGTCVVEDFAGVSPGARVFTSNDDFLGGSLTGPTVPPRLRAPVHGHVRIGRHAVVGANAVVLPAVEIGDGTTVGALSLVRQNLEGWSVYAGNPIRRLRDRPRDTLLRLERELLGSDRGLEESS